MIILQIAPVIGVGTGVGAVAYHLEQEWSRLGHDVRRLELTDTGGGWLPVPGPGFLGKAALAARVVWFSTVGTFVARRVIASLPPGAVSVCHNDALAGDVYVNHGVVLASMRARGGAAWRMLRNPLHLFTSTRDLVRYRSGLHRVVVNLSRSEAQTLGATYGQVRSEVEVIPNGVTADPLPTPSAAERKERRAQQGYTDDDLVCVFVGHEFARKGLAILCEAVAGDPHLRVLVIGGESADVLAFAAGLPPGSSSQVNFVGRVPDARPWLSLGDVLVLPSAYEANALVLLEAFGAGLPVVATRVGAAEELIRDGQNGFLVERSAQDVRRALDELRELDPQDTRVHALATASTKDWSVIAQRYLDLFTRIVPRT